MAINWRLEHRVAPVLRSSERMSGRWLAMLRDMLEGERTFVGSFVYMPHRLHAHILKDANIVSFSRATPNLAVVIPAMDFIGQPSRHNL